jgi:hypothetical protein
LKPGNALLGRRLAERLQHWCPQCGLVGGDKNLLFLFVGIIARDKEEAREAGHMVT